MSEEKDINLQGYAEHLQEQGDFASVLILVTTMDGKNHVCELGKGMTGNLYANIGAARDFILTQEEYTKQYARGDYMEDDDDE